VTGRWARLVTALRTAASQQTELQERMWLLQRPWEEDYLHWVGEGEERRLHGTVPPPQDGRRYSVTRAGWCRGLAADVRRAGGGQGGGMPGPPRTAPPGDTPWS
jgi:hypothetical protein